MIVIKSRDEEIDLKAKIVRALQLGIECENEYDCRVFLIRQLDAIFKLIQEIKVVKVDYANKNSVLP